MKITTRGQTPPAFAPIEVVILVESQLELDTLQNIADRNILIPDVVSKSGGNYNNAAYFCDALRAALRGC